MDGAVPFRVPIHTFGQLKQPIHYSVLFQAGLCFLVASPPQVLNITAVLETLKKAWRQETYRMYLSLLCTDMTTHAASASGSD